MSVISAQEYKERRKKLIELVQQHHKHEGAIMLLAGFEHDVYRFRQESSFYYFTGITEPGVVLWLDLNGHATLFIPNHGNMRSKWVQGVIEVTQEHASALGMDRVEYLGLPCDSYQLYPFFKAENHQHLLQTIKQTIDAKKKIFTLYPKTAYGYIEQRHLLDRLMSFNSEIAPAVTDISPIVAQLRRKKSKKEIELLFKAIEITTLAHEAAAHVIDPGVYEYHVQAALEYVFIESGAQRPSFPSIVGSGKNSTVLHYNQNNRVMDKNDVVVVDIGAEYNYYCADLTRTYPVSGTFTKRQREIYNLVLDTQEYIAALAQPGYWLSHKDHPEKSLNHLAKDFLKERGYEKYFPHGIGHFLGLDVHDVGDASQPLEEGDVITIEPGIYIPEEKIGVRIEDNYWIVKDGAVCLSEDLPRFADEMEKMVTEDLEHEKKAPTKTPRRNVDA